MDFGSRNILSKDKYMSHLTRVHCAWGLLLIFGVGNLVLFEMSGKSELISLLDIYTCYYFLVV